MRRATEMDVTMVGLQNAGKTSLLRVLSVRAAETSSHHLRTRESPFEEALCSLVKHGSPLPLISSLWLVSFFVPVVLAPDR
jgi:hypothetical protein